MRAARSSSFDAGSSGLKPWLSAVIAILFLAGCSQKKPARVTTVSAPSAGAGIPSKQPPPRPTAKKRPATPAAGNAKAQTKEPSTNPAAPPAFEALTTPEERLELARQTTASLERAQRNLSQLKIPGTSSAAASDIIRIESFIRQAQNAQENKDPATASTYARRAELLSEELLKR